MGQHSHSYYFDHHKPKQSRASFYISFIPLSTISQSSSSSSPMSPISSSTAPPPPPTTKPHISGTPDPHEADQVVFLQPSTTTTAALQKRKRRPAGTPDPEAEVVVLSPKTLMESDRYVCEICGQGFQREQNLQMHRRRHKLPWKMQKKKESPAESPAESMAAAAGRKRVFVCPETGCLHHDPRHALGDLVGIKKHYRRKHSGNKQWGCGRCCKAYAVQSDYKAHLKTCGTRGHSCDCGRVFSRVESFIQHQDSCGSSRPRSEPLTISSTSPSTDIQPDVPPPPPAPQHRNIELQLLPPAYIPTAEDSTELHLSIGPPHPRRQRLNNEDYPTDDDGGAVARQQLEMAERELAAARRIRQQAQAEFEKACALRAAAARQVNAMLLQITCADCRNGLRSKTLTFGAGRDGQRRWLNRPESGFE